MDEEWVPEPMPWRLRVMYVASLGALVVELADLVALARGWTTSALPAMVAIVVVAATWVATVGVVTVETLFARPRLKDLLRQAEELRREYEERRGSGS